MFVQKTKSYQGVPVANNSATLHFGRLSVPPDYVSGPHNCGHNLTVSVSNNYVMHVAGYLRDTKRSGTEYSLLTFFHPISSTVRQADSVEDNGQPVALRWRSYMGQAEALSLIHI